MAGYYSLTRKHTYSLLFALPLLVLYELGAATMAGASGGVRNGADVLLRTVLAAGGIHTTLAFTALLAGIGAVLIVREQRRQRVPLRAGVFGGMLAESVAYALVFGMVVGTATGWLINGVGLAAGGGAMDRMPMGDAVVLSLGAGIYEELLFRVLLVGGLLAIFRQFGMSKGASGTYAAILAAFLFSAFHYVGPYAYPLELGSFVFRFLSGLAFNALFITRGFGITAWTHALYDVFLVVTHRGG